MTFGSHLEDAIDKHGSLCVGIDPHAELLRDWGLPVSVEGLRSFTETCVAAFAGTVGIVKPQSAFFEVFGSAGIAVLESAIRELRVAGTLVLLDVKRGDIGSTMEAYARAYLDKDAPLASDAITVSPFLGVGSLDPAFDLATAQDAGVFVLALTSNKEGPQFQHARTEDGRTVGQTVVDEVASRNDGATPLGSFGLVVGATIGQTGTDFSVLNGPILSPGVGAQGGTPRDVRRIFGDAARNVLPSLSREVLRRGPDVAGLKAAVEQQRDAFGFLRA
ncbi:MAG TPA: orotidine-5'-phosphate decarboxylase [Jatrophihabitans sp.]|jgi:orotidine-5'-phosphate decarboxylase